MKLLLEKGALHGDCMTVTGRTLAENLAELITTVGVRGAELGLALDGDADRLGAVGAA